MSRLAKLTPLLLLFALGCTRAEKKPAWAELAVADAAAMHKAGTATFYDANTAAFRKKNGKVPGAVLLADYNGYDAAKTLPADKASQLVFYCTSRL